MLYNKICTLLASNDRSSFAIVFRTLVLEIVVVLMYLAYLSQERSLALEENRPVPSLYCSADIRPLKMEDFRHAHEQVCCD